MAEVMAGSTMRASGTCAGTVASAIRRSTPAQRDWINRRPRTRDSEPGSGLATTATSAWTGSTSPWPAAWTIQVWPGAADRKASCQAWASVGSS